MRSAARNNAKASLNKRERLAIERQRTLSLSKLFPHIERLRIELVFSDPQSISPQPSSQLHTLYPAATAFFRFICPCADCDGDFDLTEVIRNATSLASESAEPTSLHGQLECAGYRFPEHAELRARCPIQLRYDLLIEVNPARRKRG